MKSTALIALLGTGVVLAGTTNLDSLTLSENLTVTGTSALTGNVTVTGNVSAADLAASDDLTVTDDATISGTLGAVEQTIGIPFPSMRVHDNVAALLPAAGANDDLGYVQGTFGTSTMSLQADDHKNEGSAQSNIAYFEFAIPATYVAGSTISLVANAGMTTTVASTTATLDFSCYVSDYANGDGTVSGDLVTTAAQSINSTTFADKTFVVDDDSAGYVLTPGDIVQCKITTAVDDTGTGTAVIATVRKLDVVISA